MANCGDNGTEKPKDEKPEDEDICPYIIVDSSFPIEQGDIFNECPYGFPVHIDTENLENSITEYTTYNVIVIGQSCDILNDKVEMVVLCPIWEFSDYINYCKEKYKTDEKYRAKFKSKQSFIDSMKNLHKDTKELKRLGYHLIKECNLPGFNKEPLLVDFGNMYSLPPDFVKWFAENDKNNIYRLRLLPEYRVDLIARFNYMFVRGALPKGYKIEDIKVEITEADLIIEDPKEGVVAEVTDIVVNHDKTYY